MAQTIRVGMAQAGVAQHPDLIETQALGSCVGVVLYDPYTRIGGIAHAMLPDISDAKENSRGNLEKFANSAIEILIKKMEDLGAKKRFMKAKLVGGANMFPGIFSNVALSIGKRNTDAARTKLAELGILIEAEEIGDSFGRTIVLDTFTGKLKVRTAMLEEIEI
jgi:chemotaxis protein CheD